MGELLNRKHPRMKNFDYSENGYYFLTVCVKEKKEILCNIVGRGVLDTPNVILTEEGKIVEKYIHSINNVKNVVVEKYVIMPNHIHLLLHIDNIFGMNYKSSTFGAKEKVFKDGKITF